MWESLEHKKKKYVLFVSDYNIGLGIIDVQPSASLRVLEGEFPGDGEYVERRRNR